MKAGMKVKVFLKTGFKYQGILEDTDLEGFIQIKERGGTQIISVDQISQIMEMRYEE